MHTDDCVVHKKTEKVNVKVRYSDSEWQDIEEEDNNIGSGNTWYKINFLDENTMLLKIENLIVRETYEVHLETSHHEYTVENVTIYG